MTPRDPAAPPPVPITGPPKPANRSRRWIRVSLIALTIVVFVDAVVGENGVLSLLQARRQFAAVERALQQSRDDNAALREAARRLREDPGAIESVARRDLGLIKPGEKVFIVKDAVPRR